MTGTTYHIGSDAAELDRLDHQGRILGPATRAILEAAGVRAGMRVLDLGSGAGDVSFTVAEIVGTGGEIVGIDQSTDAVARASVRAQQRGLANVRFAAGDISGPVADGTFDAIVCRLVLMYLRDPAAVLRVQSRQLRRGGVVAPIEIDVSTARAVPATPLAARVLTWIGETFTRAGIQTALGPKLWSVLIDAGLRPLGMIGVQPHFGPTDPDGPRIFAGVVRTVLPLMERTGVVTAAEVAPDTLQQRLQDEMVAHSAVLAHPILLSAWGTRD
jgi:SAM-dependent methyltransferase